jgi:hypothetical protein
VKKQVNMTPPKALHSSITEIKDAEIIEILGK